VRPSSQMTRVDDSNLLIHKPHLETDLLIHFPQHFLERPLKGFTKLGGSQTHFVCLRPPPIESNILTFEEVLDLSHKSRSHSNP
jgi:hypothetical protein